MPPRMIPDLQPCAIADEHEREVYQALRAQLPDDWVVRYDYDFVARGNRRLFDGQCDFIVLVPGMGVMIIEVKGSRGFDCVDGQWYAIKADGSRERLPNPFDQAKRNKHNIVEKVICGELGIDKEHFSGKAVHGHLVAFPNCRVAGRLCHSQVPQVFVTRSHMACLRDRIEQAFVDWGVNHVRNRDWFSGRLFERVVDIFRDDMSLVQVAAIDSEADSAAIEQLTREQFDGFRAMMARSRVLVSGPAGSGKTMLAVWAAQALASMGYKVLIVCFNRNLAKWIEAKEDLPGQITVRRYHAMCREYAQMAQLPFNPPGGPQAERFWSVDSADIFLDAITKLEGEGRGDECKFDAVIVDEGQDFSDCWWMPLEILLRNPANGHFVIFHDPDQAVYSHGDDDAAPVGAIGAPAQQAFPLNMHRHVLTKNCRNTKSVVDYCGGVLRTQRPDFVLEPFARSPDGTPPILLPVMPLVGNRAARATDVVNGWIREGFRPSQIALLSPWSRNNSGSILNVLAQIANQPIRGEDSNIQEWIGDECIWGSTIKAFKGMEADCIIIADVPIVGTIGFDLSDMYVAASRAKRNLCFIPSSQAASVEISRWISGN